MGWKPSTSLAGSTESRTSLGINLRRQRELNQNAVDFIAAVQVCDQVEELRR